MAITAEDIHNQSFSIDRKGYDVDEVDVFLEHVADEIDALNNQIAMLNEQLDGSKFDGFDLHVSDEQEKAAEPAPSAVDDAAVADYEAELADKDEIIADLERQLEEKRANDNAISAALIVAQRSADEIVSKANAQAEETIQDARDEAARILNRANADKQSVLDSIRKLEDEREEVREEYQEILKDFISDATRKLADIGGAMAAAASVSALVANEYVTPRVELAGKQPTGDLTEVVEEDVEPVHYTMPQTPNAVVAAAAPVASAYEKDLSGFGDADNMEFEEID